MTPLQLRMGQTHTCTYAHKEITAHSSQYKMLFLIFDFTGHNCLKYLIAAVAAKGGTTSYDPHRVRHVWKGFSPNH